MPSRLKKIIISFLLSVFLLVNLTPISAFALSDEDLPWYNPGYDQFVARVFDEESDTEIFGERYTFAQVKWIFFSIVAIVTGGEDALMGCLAGKLLEEDKRFKDIILGCADEFAGAAYNVAKFFNPIGMNQNEPANIAEIFTSNPLSSTAYFKDVYSRLKLVPDVQAQGFGFEAANPILGLWRMVRNITYFLLILVIIVMAFMIMFRMKLSPQTVITVQSALPKIIIALILITFSYAIAGLMIDLMYVVIGLIAMIFTAGDSNSAIVWNTTAGDTSLKQWAQLYESLTERWALAHLLQYFIFFMPALFVSILSSGLLGAAIGIPIVLLLAPVILLIVGLILLVVTLRIIWLLLRTFVIILLTIIFGPIQILIGALGVGGGFGAWLKSLAANLAVYPVVGFMFVLSFVFLRGAWADVEGALPNIPDWMPFVEKGNLLDFFFPLGVRQQFEPTGGWAPPLTIGKSAMEMLWLGASFAILTMIPKAGNMIRDMIAGRPFAAGSAIGEAVGVATPFARGQLSGFGEGGEGGFGLPVYQQAANTWSGSKAGKWFKGTRVGGATTRAAGRGYAAAGQAYRRVPGSGGFESAARWGAEQASKAGQRRQN